MHKKDCTGFINKSNIPEDYDITRKINKPRSDAHDHGIVARGELVYMDPSKSMRAMARELKVSATPWFVKQLRRTSDTNSMASEKVSLCQRRQNYDN